MAFADQAIAKLRKVVEVLRRRPSRVALESRQPMPDVGGIADLAHLAVAHDIEPGVPLSRHDAGDALLQHSVYERGITLLSPLQREQHVDDFRRSRKAADVRGEDAIGNWQCLWLNAQCPTTIQRNRALGIGHWALSLRRPTRRTRRSDGTRAGSCIATVNSSLAHSARTSG